MNTSVVQTSLQVAPIHPAPYEDCHYYPILQTLPGELEALGRASDVAWRRMTPVVEVSTLGGDPMTIAPQSPLARLGKSLSAAITPGHLFFLSFHEQMRVRVIEQLLDQCLAYGLSFIPVISVQTLERAEVLRRTVGFGGGVCVRSRLSGRLHQTGRTLLGQLERVLDATVGDPAAADLLIDLGYLPQSPGFRPEHVARALEGITNLTAWRTAAIAGTVIPNTLSAVAEQDHVVKLDRHEWNYYRALRDAPLARRFGFSDYGVQSPERPEGGRGAWANIRYTTTTAVVIARGHKVTRSDPQQYRDLARLVVNDDEFSGSSFSWGDQEIAKYADGAPPPQYQEKWRAFGTSHHLELVTRELAALP